jgi:hypothetical protein
MSRLMEPRLEQPVFELYNFQTGERTEEVWPRHSDTQALVELWKDKGYRLVLEGLIVWLSDDDQGQRFIPAGKMERLWRMPDNRTGFPLTRLFIWETGSPSEEAQPAEQPATAGDDLASGN